jgi:nucleoside-diphosphate-sugar epimerase
MKERVLITGASGFIGYHLVKAAQEAGLEVHAGVRKSSDLTRLKELNPVYVYPDFSSKEALRSIVEKGDYSYIIHAAGITRAKTEDAYNLVNAIYTRDLAEASLLSDRPLKRFVFMSSLAAIGPVAYNQEQPITEATLPAPVTRYGKSKLLAEQFLNKIENLNLVTIRPTAVYGPGEKDIFILFKTLSRGLDAYIGKAPQRLSLVYVKDLAAVTIAAMLKKEAVGSTYNISDGRGYERYELADEFIKLNRRKALRIHLPFSLFKTLATLLDWGYSFSKATPVLNKEKLNELTAPNWVCSIDAARTDLDYRPAFDLPKGLEATLKWYKENNWL